MNWDSKTWKPRTRLLWLFLFFIISLCYFVNRGHAEETIGGHIQEAVFDTLSATALGFGAVEATAAGNPVTGALLCTLATREICHAYGEVRAAWDLYSSCDNPNYSDRDISPAESCMEHGRD